MSDLMLAATIAAGIVVVLIGVGCIALGVFEDRD